MTWKRMHRVWCYNAAERSRASNKDVPRNGRWSWGTSLRACWSQPPHEDEMTHPQRRNCLLHLPKKADGRSRIILSASRDEASSSGPPCLTEAEDPRGKQNEFGPSSIFNFFKVSSFSCDTGLLRMDERELRKLLRKEKPGRTDRGSGSLGRQAKKVSQGSSARHHRHLL